MGKNLFSRLVAAVLGAGLVLCFAMPANAAMVESVDLELVIATDVSPSIDAKEAYLQREGIAEAFLNPEVVKAIESGSLGKIAVAAIDFSSRQYNRVVADWHVIHDKESAAAFADTMRKARTRVGRRTSISDGIELAQLLIETNLFLGTRKVIDVSGDGPNNWGRPVNVARDEAVEKGITINGLPILGSSSGLDAYYENCVIGGPASFVVAAHGFEDFARAIRNKLIQEIASDTREPAATRPLLRKVAAQGIGPAPRGGYSRPLNETGCENLFGGFPSSNGFDFPLPLPR